MPDAHIMRCTWFEISRKLKKFWEEVYISIDVYYTYKIIKTCSGKILIYNVWNVYLKNT